MQVQGVPSPSLSGRTLFSLSVSAPRAIVSRDMATGLVVLVTVWPAKNTNSCYVHTIVLVRTVHGEQSNYTSRPGLCLWWLQCSQFALLSYVLPQIRVATIVSFITHTRGGTGGHPVHRSLHGRQRRTLLLLREDCGL